MTNQEIEKLKEDILEEMQEIAYRGAAQKIAEFYTFALHVGDPDITTNLTQKWIEPFFRIINLLNESERLPFEDQDLYDKW